MSAAAAVLPKSTTIQIHRTIQSFRKARKLIPHDKSIGFVPTMGALHEGHLSLVEKARRCNDVVVASIYVNPTQFGVGEDLDKYPRTFERDSNLLNDLGVDHIFAPENMYGENHLTYVDPTGFENTVEGQARPGHFRGVATIVTKLFNIIQPTNAYFGQKDAAQCALIRRIVDDLNMDVNVQVLDTMREVDGLAMSSRNAYLDSSSSSGGGEERKAASVLYKSLCVAQNLFQSTMSKSTTTSSSSLSSSTVMEAVTNVLRSEPLVTDIQYVSIDSKETMMSLNEIGSDGAIVSIACKIGTVRLIDNIVL